MAREARNAYDILADLARFSGFDKAIVPLLGAIVVLLASTLLARRRGSAHSELDLDRFMALGWATAGAFGLLAIHGLFRWMQLPWYFVPGSLLLVLWFGALLSCLSPHHVRWTAVLGFAFLVFQLRHGAGLALQGVDWQAQARSVTALLETLPETCERFGTIGVSDSGYAGYYSNCRVVNLDGVVNNRAYTAIREGRFRQYLDEAGIRHVELNDTVRKVVELREKPIPETAPFAPRTGEMAGT